ncbi:hypothetical protein BC739_000949 [Kutzneria viridogrisea]|uniref:Uncharacterized protein n=2 Tax=Kutzneria TaxID=43356 RepID=W5WDA5_9PSEU|nr:hypothetical protein KALB_5373 [Kutzneria albida DSM 43870]MBA8923752.1 hypothetical protein [Kutzneria viridogrisea]
MRAVTYENQLPRDNIPQRGGSPADQPRTTEAAGREVSGVQAALHDPLRCVPIRWAIATNGQDLSRQRGSQSLEQAWAVRRVISPPTASATGGRTGSRAGACRQCFSSVLVGPVLVTFTPGTEPAKGSRHRRPGRPPPQLRPAPLCAAARCLPRPQARRQRNHRGPSARPDGPHPAHPCRVPRQPAMRAIGGALLGLVTVLVAGRGSAVAAGRLVARRPLGQCDRRWCHEDTPLRRGVLMAAVKPR